MTTTRAKKKKNPHKVLHQFFFKTHHWNQTNLTEITELNYACTKNTHHHTLKSSHVSHLCARTAPSSWSRPAAPRKMMRDGCSWCFTLCFFLNPVCEKRPSASELFSAPEPDLRGGNTAAAVKQRRQQQQLPGAGQLQTETQCLLPEQATSPSVIIITSSSSSMETQVPPFTTTGCKCVIGWKWWNIYTWCFLCEVFFFFFCGFSVCSKWKLFQDVLNRKE